MYWPTRGPTTPTRTTSWSALRCTALALHWYDPLVWLAVSLSKADGELACDEGAVRRLGEEERTPYGRTLVDMVAQRSRGPPTCCPAPLQWPEEASASNSGWPFW
ncbi:MAG: M56 family metallopeptidase [Oscillospiraceae bacterium]